MTEPMRVLHVIDSFAVGGTETSLLEMVRAQRWQALVAAIYVADTLRSEFEKAGAVTFHLGLDKPWGLGVASRWVRRLVREHRPDLMHCALYRSGIVSRLVGLSSGVPVVDSFVNDSYGPSRISASNASQRLRIRAIQVLDRALAGVPALYISNSRTIAESNAAQLRVCSDRIRVVHRGRNASAFEAPGEARTRLRREMGLAGAVIAHVGRFVEQKDHDTLIDAFAELDREASLVLVGDGPRLETIRERVRQRGVEDRVFFFGTRRDVAAVLACADVFAFPSRFEGWPGAVIEAMMAGIPVVASDLAVHREIDGGSGSILFFPPGSAPALAKHVRALLDDRALAELHAERAHERARQFTVEAMADGHLAAFAEVLARS